MGSPPFSSPFFLFILFFCCVDISVGIWPAPQELTLQGAKVYGVASRKKFSISTNDPWVKWAVSYYTESNLIFPLESTGSFTTSKSSGGKVFVDKVVKKLSIHVTNVSSEQKLSYVSRLNLMPSEEYELQIEGSTAKLNCPEAVGCLRGLETFSQLVRFSPDDGVYFIDLYGHPGLKEQTEQSTWLREVCPLQIKDYPTFKWRGLMLDTSRHFIPTHSLANLVNSMAYNKLNVLHWHPTDAEAFSLGSTEFPALADLGSWTPGSSTTTYSVGTISALSQYAARLGIRLVLELDTPAHTASWTKGLPNITLECGPSDGSSTPYLDPTSSETYSTLKTLFSEYTRLAPDSYFHLGGDDVDTKCWENNPKTQKWMQDNMMTSSELLAYYYDQVLEVFNSLDLEEEDGEEEKEGEREGERYSIVWEDVLQVSPNASASVIQLWREEGPQSTLEQIISAGKSALVSRGWCSPRNGTGEARRLWSDLYVSNPTLDSTNALEFGEQLLGGEICMWGSEFDSQNLDDAVWPSASAAAERLWLGNGIVVPDFAQSRLNVFRCRLAQRGVAVGPLESDYCPLPSTPHKDGRQWSLLLEPATFCIVLIAIFCITLGSYRSLNLMKEGNAPAVAGENLEEVTVVNGKTVFLIPIFASATLILLFFFLDILYYIIFTMVSLSAFMSLIGLTEPWFDEILKRIPSARLEFEIPKIGLTKTSVLSGVAVAITVLLVWIVECAWWASDLMGIAMAVMGLTYLQLPSLKIAFIFLWIFFFYDLFWVFLSPYLFGESVMEQVAINLASPQETTRPLPIALEVPYAFSDGFQLIGLGDIVLPGILVALLMRFDSRLPEVRSEELNNWLQFISPWTDFLYFRLGLFCYVCGIYTCLICLIKFDTAQPALIYLVPWTCFPIVGVAYWLGDLEHMWSDNSSLSYLHVSPTEEEEPQTEGTNISVEGEEEIVVNLGEEEDGKQVIEMSDLSEEPHLSDSSSPPRSPFIESSDA